MSLRSHAPTEATPPAVGSGWTRALCWTTVTLEGFDIVALSASLPTILDTAHVGIDKAAATFITTISLVGILVGALMVGPISDRLGRKSSLLGSIALFSVLTLIVPWAGDVTTFAALRFFAGIGLGACMPTDFSASLPSLCPSWRASCFTGAHWLKSAWPSSPLLTIRSTSSRLARSRSCARPAASSR